MEYEISCSIFFVFVPIAPATLSLRQGEYP